MAVQTLAYGKSVTIRGPSLEQVVDRVRVLLQEEDFGVLCDIDVAAKLKEKIGIDRAPYRILGACNPKVANDAINAEPHLGLLLPCNFLVRETDGAIEVSAVDAAAMLRLVGNPALEATAADVNAAFARILERLG